VLDWVEEGIDLALEGGFLIAEYSVDNPGPGGNWIKLVVGSVLGNGDVFFAVLL
jgi:hypothetical protein